jgi:O-acetyl-ADP-ribose deacetylase (regulator of RNase III)
MSIRYKLGDLLESDAEALVNTVNCVGVMGKGIALSFKRRYPSMFRRYTELCKKGEVQLGRPYIDRNDGRTIINFPTKGHWKARSRMVDVIAGLQFLRTHIDQWNIKSLALPPLGCGHGGLNWDDVRPLIEKELGDLPIDVQVYVPQSSREAALLVPESRTDREKSIKRSQMLLFEPDAPRSIDGVH